MPEMEEYKSEHFMIIFRTITLTNTSICTTEFKTRNDTNRSVESSQICSIKIHEQCNRDVK